MSKFTFKEVSTRLSNISKPISILLESENFSISLELEDANIEELPGNGGISISYDNSNIKTDVNIYRNDPTVRVYNDNSFEVKIIYENGDSAEIIA